MSYFSSSYWEARYWGALYFGTLAEPIIYVEGIMADPLAVRPWYAGLFTGITTKVDLGTLLKALYAGFAQPIVIADVTGIEVRLFAAVANTQRVLIGDEHLSTTNYGNSVAAGTTERFGPYNVSNFPLSDVFVMSADGATAVALGIMVFVG